MTKEARERSFDELARDLASGSISRGRALKLMGAALVGGTLASLGIGEASADLCKRTGKACKKDSQCCSGNCANGFCCESGRLPNGAPCGTSTDCCSGNCTGGFCCPAGTVRLSNGTCAQLCPPTPGCTGRLPDGTPCGCYTQRDFCGSIGPSVGDCDITSEGGDSLCPPGSFCIRTGPGGPDVCVVAC